MELRQHNPRPSPAVLAAVERARRWMDAHYREDPSLAVVAAVAGVSPYYFHRVFRATVGVTVKRYVDGLRWAEVERMVARGVARAEIARRLNFCSGGYVSTRSRLRERGGVGASGVDGGGSPSPSLLGMTGGEKGARGAAR